MGWAGRLERRLLHADPPFKLSPGDFPAGVAAPVGDIASVPLRPTLIGFTPRGSSAALLLAVGGIKIEGSAAPERATDGLLKTAYAMDGKAIAFHKEDDLRRALAFGAENGGVDLAALSVDRLAQWATSLRDAAPRAVLMLGRSRGQEALAAVGAATLPELRGKRLGVYPQSSCYYFALWCLTRIGLSPTDLTWVELPSSLEAGRALREGRVDAVSGLYGDVELAARDRGGKVLASTADAPHLIVTVLVARGEFAARYPDALRRVLRSLLDASGAVKKDSSTAARLLGEVAPYLGDPTDAIKSSPPASLEDNLAFFGLSGEAPVTYDELFQSSAALFAKMGKGLPAPPAEDTRELGPLKYIVEARGL